jgi:hypothetical protein
VRALLITTVEVPVESTPGEIDRLLEFAIPEIYRILELTALDLQSNTDLVVPQIEPAGHDLIVHCEYSTVAFGKPRDNIL